MSGAFDLILTANAASPSTVAAFGSFMDPIVSNVLNPILELAFAVAAAVFVYGVLKLVFHGTEESAHTEGRWAILGGLIGMFLMTCAWGIIYVIANTVNGFK
ncbi:MAG TPA: hypothetical protein VF438_00380 [Candidatus Paceibacterota bacterium]